MSEGWRGVALVTGSGALVSPAGANRDNEGVLGGRRGGRDGAQTRPLPLPASFAPVLPVCSSSSFALDLISFPLFLPPSLSVHLTLPLFLILLSPPAPFFSYSTLSISFHFSCTGCTRFNNYRPHFVPPLSLSPPHPPRSSLHLHFSFPIHFCLPLKASSSSPPLHPVLHPSLQYFKMDRK